MEYNNVIIWSKNNCFYCLWAKKLLNNKNINFEERNIDSDDWTKDQLLELNNNIKTFPAIFFDKTYIGGFAELKNILKD